MQISSGTQIPDGILADFALRNEKPRLGVPSRNPALHQGINASNSTIVLGLQSTAALNRIGSRCTGKERDAESGNDYFDARYYASSMGRFMSPDWSAQEEPVPYAKLDAPQSLNLYSYVLNNPLTNTDADGHVVDPAQVQKFANNFTTGIVKGAWNFVANAWNTTASLLNAQAGANVLQLAPTASYSNATQAVTGAVTQIVGVAAGGIEGGVGDAAGTADAAGAAAAARDATAATTGSGTATVVGAYDATTGATATGASGPLSRLASVNPQVSAAADAVGGMGAKNPGVSPVGCCAEVDAANKLTNQGSSLQNVRFTPAIRPRKPEVVVPKCTNCQKMFPNQ